MSNSLPPLLFAACLAGPGQPNEALRLILQMPSPCAIGKRIASSDPKQAPILLANLNRQLLAYARCPAQQQRGALLTFLSQARTWRRAHSKVEDDYTFDCGKLDFLALARGRPPKIGSLWREFERSPNHRGISFIPGAKLYHDSGPPSELEQWPYLDLASIRSGVTLVKKGYYDLPLQAVGG